jgi:hypothetical protein
MPVPVEGNSILATKFLHHVQIDLVPFEKCPDSEYYIVHLRSQDSPEHRKKAAEVAVLIVMFTVFSIFGPPFILQGDNG